MKKTALLLALVTTLSACGFQLRGSYDMPALLQNLRVEAATHSPLKPELELALQTTGVNTAEAGDLKLVIEHEKLNRQTTTVDNRAKVSEYTLVYDVQYRLRYSADNRPAEERHTLLLRRSYQYDNTSIVGKNTEEATLTEELRRDVVQQIVRQLSAVRAERLLPSGEDSNTPEASPASPAQP